jgi:quinol monooxygenase YgiN
MITVIATVQAKPGRGAELEADFRAWAEVVKEKEPGTLQYTLSRSRESPDLFYALETYRDQAAVDVHMANLHARGGDGPPDFFAAPPIIQVLDRVV